MSSSRKQTGGLWDPTHRYLYFLAMRPTMALACGDNADAVLTAVNEIGDGADLAAFGELLSRGVPLLIDSGVFNLASRHAEAHGVTHDEALRTPLEQLDGFAELWERYTTLVGTYGEKTWGYIELDLGGHVQKRNTRARLEEMGLRPIPVYHALNDPVEYFDELAETYDRICVGNLVQASPETRKRILCSIYLRRRQFPGLKWIHALGVTPNQVLNAFPFESVDSTTWMATIRFVQGCTPRTCLRTLGGMGKGFRYTHENQGEHRIATAMGAYWASMNGRCWRHYMQVLEGLR